MQSETRKYFWVSDVTQVGIRKTFLAQHARQHKLRKYVGSDRTQQEIRKKNVRGQVRHSKKLEHKLKGGSCTREIIHGIGSEIDGCRYEWILGSQALAVLTSHSSLSLMGSVTASLFAVSKDDHNLVQSTDNLVLGQ